MKLIKLNLAFVFLLITLSNHAQTSNESAFALGLSTGYNNGFGVQVNGAAKTLAEFTHSITSRDRLY